MRKTGQKTRLMLSVCLLVILFCTTCLSATAADTTDIEPEKEGSISLTLYSDEAGETVTDGALTLYEVAKLTLTDGSMVYVRTEAFAGFDGELDIEDTGLAKDLSAYVSSSSVTGTTKMIESDGSVRFSDLTLGLYLLVQTTPSTGYYTIDPFLVTVPLTQDGVWVYDVDASPKVEVNPEPSPEPEPEPEPEPTPEPKLEPTPTPIPDKTLPQTGQLFWPIPILAGAGALFIMIGSMMRRRRRAA